MKKSNLTNQISFLRIRYWFLFTLIVAGCGEETPPSDTPTLTDHKVQTVEVVNPEIRSFTSEIEITGSARPNQMVMVHAMESGFVKSVYRDIGDFVSTGQILAEMENPELMQQLTRIKADLLMARADLDQTKAEMIKMDALERAKQSHYQRIQAIADKTPSLTTLQELEQAHADAESASANVLASRAILESINTRIEAANSILQIMEVRVGLLHIRAPFSGIISARYIDKGAAIQSGMSNTGATALFEIQDLNPIRLTIPVPESDAVLVKAGIVVEVTFPELAGPSFDARVSRTAKALDPASGTMRVEIDLENPNGDILPGMYAKVRIQVNSRNDVLSLPVTAQLVQQDAFFVLEVRDLTVNRVPLRKGIMNREFFEVLNPEISHQSQVIVQGKSLVKPGQQVRPIIKNN